MNCERIRNLVYYYIYNELDPALEEYISMHLEECKECNLYYHDMLQNIKENKYLEEISAYIDNELSDNESIKVKKNIINNVNAREEFERMNSLTELLKSSLSRKNNSAKHDYTKLIFRQLNLMDEVYGKSRFAEVMGIFVVFFVGLLLAALALYAE